MEGDESLGFLGNLKECIKIISNSGKPIIAITTMSIILDYLLLFLTKSSTNTVTGNLLAPESLLSPSTSNSINVVYSADKIKKDVQIIIGFEFLSLLPSLAIYSFSLVTMILGFIMAYRINNLSFEGFLIISKLCLTTIVASFHLLLFMIGYIGLLTSLLISLMIAHMDPLLLLIPVAITFGLFSFIFWMYFAFLSDMALVMSMLLIKTNRGPQALGNDGGLVKEVNRLHGLAQKFAFALGLLTVIVCISLRGNINPQQKQIWTQIIRGLFASVWNSLVIIVYLVSCTLYFQGKKMYAEEIELLGIMDISKIRNHSGGANLKPVLVMLFFAVLTFLWWKGIWYRLIFPSNSSDANQMLEQMLASGGS